MNEKHLQLLRGLILGLLLCTCVLASASQPSISLSGLPLFFEPQESVMGEACGFLARGQNYQFAITATGAEIVLSKAESQPNNSPSHATCIADHATRNAQHATRAVQMQSLGV